MKSLFAILAFALVGCGAMTGMQVDPKLKGAVDRYMAHVPNQGHYDELQSVQFGTPSKEAFGECTFKRGERHVIIKRVDELETLLEVTVAHELAHCLHDKGHDDSGVKLMNTYRSGSEEFWSVNLNEQIEAMFK